MTRRCSHCSNNGHNSRTCPNRGLKLFGVRITDGSIRKSASMGNLTYYKGSGTTGGAGGTDLDSTEDAPDHNNAADGYGSEDFVVGSSSGRERKKGVPWTEEEHKMFLQGLQKLGKGDWRGIAKNYVISRTPTQVASHAQKYFIRQCNMSRRKRRSSLFDMVADDGNPSQPEPPSVNNLMCVPTPEEEVEECESVDLPINLMHREGTQYYYPVMFPAYVSPFMPVAIPFWAPVPQPAAAAAAKTESHEVLKPTAVHSKSPINVDEVVGLSKLSLAESIGDVRPNSLKVVGSLGHQSAFHANNPNPASSGHSPIHAV